MSTLKTFIPAIVIVLTIQCVKAQSVSYKAAITSDSIHHLDVSEDGNIWVATTRKEIILWDDQEKKVRWQRPHKALVKYTATSPNRHVVYKPGPAVFGENHVLQAIPGTYSLKLGIKAYAIENGEPSDIGNTDQHQSTYSSLCRVPGSYDKFLVVGLPNENKRNFKSDVGSFNIEFANGRFGWFHHNGKMLITGEPPEYQQPVKYTMLSFDPDYSFESNDSSIKLRAKTSARTYHLLLSDDGKYMYAARSLRSVNYKREYLLDRVFLLTKKAMDSQVLPGRPVALTYLSHNQLLLATEDDDSGQTVWSIVNIADWTMQQVSLPITGITGTYYDAPRNRALVFDSSGTVWVVGPGNGDNLVVNNNSQTNPNPPSNTNETTTTNQTTVVTHNSRSDLEAIEMVKSDHTSAQADPNYWSNKAFDYSDKRLFGAAEASMKKVYDVYPDNFFSAAFYGWFKMLNQKKQEAKSLIEKAVSMEPWKPLGYQLLCYTELLAGNTEKAKELMLKTVSFTYEDAGLGEKNTDFDILKDAGYTVDFESFDRWVLEFVNEDLTKRASNKKLFESAQKITNPKDKLLKLEAVIASEKNLNAPRAIVMGSSYVEASAAARKTGKVVKSIEYVERGISYLQPYGDPQLLTAAFVYAGHAYNANYDFSSSRSNYEKAIALMDKYQGDFNLYRAGALNGLGGSYQNTGQLDRAITYYEEAVELAKKQQNKNDEAIALGNLATVFIEQGKQVPQALQLLKSAEIIYARQGDKVALAKNYNNLAYAYMLLNQLPEAVQSFKRAEQLFLELGMTTSLGLVNNSIGKLLISMNQKIAAIEYYRKALKYVNEKEDPQLAKLVYANLAGALLGQEQYQEAIKWSDRAIELNEIMLKNAEARDIRGLRSATNNYYRITSLSYHRLGNYQQAFEAHESNRSREMLSKLKGGNVSGTISSTALQNMLTPQQAVIDYSVVHLNWEVHSHLFPIVLTNISVTGKEYSDSTLMTSLLSQGKTEFEAFFGNQESLLKQVKPFLEKSGLPENVAYSTIRTSNLEKTIEFYRAKIKEVNNPASNVLWKSYSKIFYQLLIAPIETQLQGKTELLIIPDGPLAFLPFETLLDENNVYLGEKYDIRYIQSATVLQEISKRKYPDSRQPILAFAGPTFERVSTNEVNQYRGGNRTLTFADIQNSYYDAEEGGKSMRPTYIKMGFTQANPLPGTIYEANQIKKIVPQTVLYTGDDATEENLKKLQSSLKNYRVLHFATHGKAFSEIPELSNLLLAQFATPRGTEDGYLRAPEIEQLQLNADFINLSACETALGRLYSSEGVIGLTQAFLIAGANAISVTQWPVDDKGTSIFMSEMYKKVFEDNLTILKAFTATKKEFIEGKYGATFQHPNFWGPFQYYGM